MPMALEILKPFEKELLLIFKLEKVLLPSTGFDIRDKNLLFVSSYPK